MDTRYSRQEALKLIGPTGQKRILKSSVAIVGCGALGSVSAELLTRAGIGSLTLIDHDVVDVTNLQRQALYTEDDINSPKAKALKGHLRTINSNVNITDHNKHLNFENINTILKKHDLILDCTDNIDTRRLINQFCIKNKKPWVHSAAIQEKGVIINFLPKGPCFNCVFPKASGSGSCEELGILNTTSHITSSMQVTEALKIILNKQPEKGMIRINTWTHRVDMIKIKRNPKCTVCKGEFRQLKGDVPEFTIQECKTKKGLSAKPRRNIQLNLKNIKKKFKTILDAEILIVIEKDGEIIVHGYGELLFKELKDRDKIKEIATEIYAAGGAHDKP